ncbi:MAG: ATP-binding cassette domain-containing protein [Candidatus Brocadiaceae bacterium]|nr:ATP-binding cassette domain-containing protein [Candidatus Brocadiaceae bacterium]
MIQVEHLSKRFGDKTAVDDISFRVDEGEILGFLGPNGAGKSTTMRILTGFLPATSGTARVAGYDVFTDSLNVRKQIGYLPENVPLYLDMRVNEYLTFRAQLKGVPRKDRRARIQEALEKCGVVEVQNQIVGTLSKGYRQRVGLADTMVHNPRILILDEPTIGLDPNQIRQVRSLIKELGKKHTILLSTHILPEVEMICGRVIIINNGKLVAMDTPGNLTSKLRGGATIHLEAKGPFRQIKAGLEGIPSVLSVKGEDESAAPSGTRTKTHRFVLETDKGRDVREEVFNAFVENKWVLLGMKKEAVTLEEVFHQITTREAEEAAGPLPPAEGPAPKGGIKETVSGLLSRVKSKGSRA